MNLPLQQAEIANKKVKRERSVSVCRSTPSVVVHLLLFLLARLLLTTRETVLFVIHHHLVSAVVTLLFHSLSSSESVHWSTALSAQQGHILSSLVSMVTGTFVPTYFRSQERKYWERKYHRCNFRSLVIPLPGTLAAESENDVELSLPWSKYWR